MILPDLQAAFTSVITVDKPVAIAPHLAYQLQGRDLIKIVGNLYFRPPEIGGLEK